MRSFLLYIFIYPIIILISVVFGTRDWCLAKIKYLRREKYGDKSKRHLCCDVLPKTYDDNQSINEIIELKDKTIQTANLNGPWTEVFCCKICGQEWHSRVKINPDIPPHYHSGYSYLNYVIKK